MMVSDAERLLKSVELFSLCSDDDLSVIASHSRFMELADGEAVFLEHQQPDRLYRVEKGEVVVRKTDDAGIPADIARYLPGDCFGELDLFADEKHNASAYALGDAILLVFPDSGGGFGEILGDYPGVGARLLNTFLVQISARIRRVNALVKENSPLVQDLKRQAYEDKLTGLFNKTCFEETLARIIKAGREPAGLLMFKPDNFKDVNDRYGHETGDRVLRLIADRLCEIVPRRDMLYRYMGNENALILPGAGREQLVQTAQHIGDRIRSIDLQPLTGQAGLNLSVSFGLGITPDHGTTAEELIAAVHPLPLEGRRRGGNLRLFPEDHFVS
jgi:diguanylate cyclase (GGDEF)-like protein